MSHDQLEYMSAAAIGADINDISGMNSWQSIEENIITIHGFCGITAQRQYMSITYSMYKALR